MKSKHLEERETILECISCERKYKTVTASREKNIKIESCKGCAMLYTGQQQKKTGSMESFHARAEKTDKINAEKTKSQE
jgi:ribosomal protein L31